MNNTPISDELNERSKFDNRMIVGSEVRAAIQELRQQLSTITEENVDLKLQRDKLMLVCEEETGAIKTITEEKELWRKLAGKRGVEIETLTADLDTSEAACADLMTLNDKWADAINYLIDKHLPANHLTAGEHRHFMSLLNKAETLKASKEEQK